MFNTGACITALKLYLSIALFDTAKRFLDEARSHMTTPEGANSLLDVSIDDINTIADIIAVKIVGGAYAAMDNYGTGSLMDRDNPALGYYFGNDDLWNPLRKDYTVVGRKAGKYKNIFGVEVTSRGYHAGEPIEYPAYEGEHPFIPIPPSHALETAARWITNGEMQNIIKTTLEKFPFHLFFIVTDGGGGDIV